MPFIIASAVVVVLGFAVHFFILVPRNLRKAAYEGGFIDGKEWINYGEGVNLHVWFTPGLYQATLRDFYEKGFYAGVEDCKPAERKGARACPQSYGRGK